MRGEVHIWLAWVEDAKPHAESLIATLSKDEKARGERFVGPDRCQRFLLMQAILRDILGYYIDQPPASIVLSRSAHGKPYVKNFDLQFNLTHSNECVLVAVTTKHEIGVDVECLDSSHRFDDLVKRFFSIEEQVEYFLYASEEERRVAFYRAWTRKEAYLKAVGLGLSYPLHQFAVSLEPEETHALLRVEDDTSVCTKWTLFSFDVDESYLASVAIQAPVDNLQTYRWSFSSTS